MSPQRASGRRFAAFVGALGLAAGAFGAVALPRLAADDLPPALQAPPAKTLVEQKLEDGRCGRDGGFEPTGGSRGDSALQSPT